MLSREMYKRGFRPGKQLDVAELYVLMVGIVEQCQASDMAAIPVYVDDSKARELGRIYVNKAKKQINILHFPAEDRNLILDGRTPGLALVKKAMNDKLESLKIDGAYQVHRHYAIAQSGNQHYVYGYQCGERLRIRDALFASIIYPREKIYRLLGIKPDQVDYHNQNCQLNDWQCGYYAAYQFQRALSEINGNKIKFKDPFAGTLLDDGKEQQVLNAFNTYFNAARDQFCDEKIENESNVIDDDFSLEDDGVWDDIESSAPVNKTPEEFKLSPAMKGALIGLGLVLLIGVAAAVLIATGGGGFPVLAPAAQLMVTGLNAISGVIAANVLSASLAGSAAAVAVATSASLSVAAMAVIGVFAAAAHFCTMAVKRIFAKTQSEPKQDLNDFELVDETTPLLSRALGVSSQPKIRTEVSKDLPESEASSESESYAMQEVPLDPASLRRHLF